MDTDCLDSVNQKFDTTLSNFPVQTSAPGMKVMLLV